MILNKISYVVLGFWLLLLSVSFTIGQTEEQDKEDAILQANKVARYMQETQDLRLVLAEYAIKNFLDGTVDNHLFNPFVFVDKSLIKKLDQNTRDAYYLAASNLFYLAVLYTATQKPKINKFGGDDLVFPPGVEKMLNGKPILAILIDEKIPPPKTIETLRRSTVNIEKVISVYRRYMKDLRIKPYERYLELTSKSLGGGEKFFTTEVSKCDEFLPKCRGLSKGSRMILVKVPGFHYVVFARVGGLMKIVHIFHGDGD